MKTDSYVLGIETSGSYTSLALVRNQQLYTQTLASGSIHNEVVLPLLRKLFSEASALLQDVEVIGVSIGPGMFTSLRVGLSTAKGLAAALHVPVIGVGTLPALAATASTDAPVLTLIDARKDEVYAALYAEDEELLSPRILATSLVSVLLRQLVSSPKSGIALAGSGVPLCLEALAAAEVDAFDTGIRYPTAVAVAAIAKKTLARSGPGDVQSLEPIYLRRTDAELNRERRPIGR